MNDIFMLGSGGGVSNKIKIPLNYIIKLPNLCFGKTQITVASPPPRKLMNE